MMPARRLQAALRPDQPAPTAAALEKLAHALRDEGMSQAALYRLFQAEHARSTSTNRAWKRWPRPWI
jgi:hypothetical protein